MARRRQGFLAGRASVVPAHGSVHFRSFRFAFGQMALRRSLHQATRSSSTESFGSVTELVALNDPFFSDILPRLSTDGLQLYFTLNRFGGVGVADVWWSTREALGDPFLAPSV